MNSPWRDRPIAESLKLFDEMKKGLIEEGKATLRMKQDMQSDNFNMYDLIAYRIKVSSILAFWLTRLNFVDTEMLPLSHPVHSSSTCWRQVVYLSKL